MVKTLLRLLDFLFPPRLTELEIRTCTAQKIKSFVKPTVVDGHITLLSYHNDMVKALITEAKFYNSPTAQRLLASALEIWIDSLPSRTLRLVPIPLSRERFKKREHNQVTSIIKNLKAVSIDECILFRTVNTAPQMNLSRQERLTNVAGAFAVDQKFTRYMRAHETVIIVDDVMTTGATLAAARAQLAPQLSPSTTLLTVALAH